MAIDHAGDLFFAAQDQVDEVRSGTSTPVPLPFQGLQSAVGVAVDTHGDVFVADFYGAGKVEELPTGSVTPITLPLSNPQPTSIATDAAGDLYVFEYGGQVAEIAAGSTAPQILPFTFGVDSGGTVDAAGNVFATNSFEDTVTEYAAGSWTPTALPFGNQVSYPTAIAVDAKDDVFVPNGLGQPVELTPGSSTPIAVGSPVFAYDSAYGSDVAADPSGDVYFLAQQLTEDSNGDATATPTMIEELHANPGIGAGQPRPTVRYTGAVLGLAVDGSGNLYFLTGGSGVQVLAPGATTPTTLFASAISDARSIAVDRAGDIFLLTGSTGPVEEIKAGTTDPSTLPFPAINGAIGIAVDGAGDVFVGSNSGFSAFTTGSVVELPAGSQSVTNLSFPGLGLLNAVATDAAGDVVVAGDPDLLNGGQIDYLAHGSTTATVLPFAGLGNDQSNGGPSGVGVDGHGDVFVTDGDLGLSEIPALVGSTTGTS